MAKEGKTRRAETPNPNDTGLDAGHGGETHQTAGEDRRRS